MATLKARGREEWLRMVKLEEYAVSGDLPARKLRTVRAYMSDGHMLEKKSFLHADGTIDFDSGWKDIGKTKTRGGWNIALVQSSLEAKGWTVVPGGRSRV